VKRPLRIAFLKPDHGVNGGLEAVVAQLERVARQDGYDVSRLSVDMRPTHARVADLDIPRHVWDNSPEYFSYLAAWDRFELLDTRRFDVVVSTQPPSFAVNHPRHLALFYHHHRVYYDLADTYLEAGYVSDALVHAEATALIRELDQPALEDVGWFLAGSQTVADRLKHFNDRDNVSVFHAGLIVGRELPAQPPKPNPTKPSVLTVARHEFPKRAELVVAAAHLLNDTTVSVVGKGGREGWLRHLDNQFARAQLDPATVDPRSLWCTTGRDLPSSVGVLAKPSSKVELCGRLSDDELTQRYSEATCVVAPAFDEDYGLTAIEAMAMAKPVIVCNDGGGLRELVDHQVTGLVVEPTPSAIAEAIERLTADRDLAAELGANGLIKANELTWDRAADEWRLGLEQVLA